MNRQQIENAINSLEILFFYEVQGENVQEQHYQEWLEKYSIVFDLLGYKKVIPHPKLEANGKVLIPDFLVQGIDDIWSIFEIKRPDTGLLKRQSKRKEFYSSFRDYISQCHEYAEFFDDQANRDWFNSKYDVVVQKSLRSLIVAGRNEGLDKAEIQKIMLREGAKIELKTYDDLLNTLEYHREKTYGQYDDIEGFTAGGIFSVSKYEGKNFLIDIGMDPQKNRISIFINRGDELCLRVLDANGKEYSTKLPMGSADLSYENLFAMCFEVGIANNSTIICIEINCEHFKDIFIDNIKFDTKYIFSNESDNKYVNILFGTDISFNEKSDFEFGVFFLYDKKLSFKLRSELRYYLYGKMFEKFKTTIYGVKSNQFASTSTNLISPRKQKNSNINNIVNLPYGIESIPKPIFEFYPQKVRLDRKFKFE